jgi:signal transduction histidine kinase
VAEARFSVDTHLFRELGELLVGRDSTALLELLKNSYDADATEVTVFGENLANIRGGRIVITDNGTGMDPQQFQDGFLRIASRLKDVSDRRSRLYHRRFTGAKGVGRLAAHKLARQIEVSSIPYSEKSTTRLPGVEAVIDWDLVEKAESLDDISDRALIVNEVRPARTAAHGTEIRLTRLRNPWSGTQRGQFLREIGGFRPPELLYQGNNSIEFPLFGNGLKVRDVRSSRGMQFDLLLEGDFAGGEEYFVPSPSSASWIIEVDATNTPGDVRVVIAPTRAEVAVTPTAEPRRFSFPHPGGRKGPQFEARILVHEGSRPGRYEVGKPWPKHLSGVRVYMEGFRVLPYGEASDDWLGIDAAYRSRTDRLPMLRIPSVDFGLAIEREGLITLGSRNYLGGVFLTERLAPNLKMLVNREGFVPNSDFEQIFTIVRTSIDLSIRVRASFSIEPRTARKVERRARASTRERVVAPEEFTERLLEVARVASTARANAGRGDIPAAVAQIEAAAELVTQISAAAVDLASEQAMLRVLASLGTQMSAFVHEVNALLGLAQQLEDAITEIADASRIRGLRTLVRDTAELRRGLERQASYLLDVVTPDARRRRASQPLRRQFEAATALVALAAARRGIVIENRIPEGIKSPPMFRAELTAVFSNLLTNAVKNAGDDGKVRASAKLGDDDELEVRLENTGVSVDPHDGERWFTPFESTTVDVDLALGQGMGLGLPITRSILEDYGGTVRFASPGAGFGTAVEIRLPKGRQR